MTVLRGRGGTYVPDNRREVCLLRGVESASGHVPFALLEGLRF